MNPQELYVAEPNSVGPSQGGCEPGSEGDVKILSDLLHHPSLCCWPALPLPMLFSFGLHDSREAHVPLQVIGVSETSHIH